MFKKALGIIEAKGLAIGVVAADAAVKAANVTLIGYELSGGAGYTTIKLEGDVGAVTAAVQSGVMAANQGIGIVGCRIIPRPVDGLEMMIRNTATVGYSTNPSTPESVDPNFTRPVLARESKSENEDKLIPQAAPATPASWEKTKLVSLTKDEEKSEAPAARSSAPQLAMAAKPSGKKSKKSGGK